MKIVFFTHPTFLGSQSMPRFAKMLADGMAARGHQAEVWSPEAKFFKLPVPGSIKKWMGYIDQYLVFPAQSKKKIKSYPADTLFVFTDHALGPWVPLVAHKHHVIHCHDFLAQRSALGEIPQNPTRSTGKKYQAYIRKGYQQGKNFVSVSEKTREDLHRFLGFKPQLSEMVYNGLNPAFILQDINGARLSLGKQTGIDLSNGYILHVGGNQWYKNRPGVIEIYEAWRDKNTGIIPLIMIGAPANARLIEKRNSSLYLKDIHILTGIDDSLVRQAYGGASVFLFPSLAEGFGWPIAEAMASGCPVITTDEAPMTEVGGDAAYYIPKRPVNSDVSVWVGNAAAKLDKLITLPPAQRDLLVAAGLKNAERFNLTRALNQIEHIYKTVVTTGQ